VGALYVFGRTVPNKKPAVEKAESGDTVPVDTILADAKRRLTPEQVTRLSALEQTVKRGNVKEQQLEVYRQLADFWRDSAHFFEPYAWYEAEASRLENSEKSLTFAAHLFLENLRGENNPALLKWKALQARDLFERSLKINPANDSSVVGLGACYIFGNISETPMEGILKVKSVVDKDSENIFAQEVLGHGSFLSGQYDKAISRFETVFRLSKTNEVMQLRAALIIADAYERKGNASSAIDWYKKALPFIGNDNEDLRSAVHKRIDDLSAKN
jgi:tetratricopeptide (TPR) repeat protein